MLKNYFTVAFRNLVKHKFYSLINIIGLSIGLTCFLMITLFVTDELSYDKFHPDIDRMYRMDFTGAINGPESKNARVGAPIAEVMLKDFPPTGEEIPVYDAAMKYQEEGTPLVVIGGKEYGSGSSRDWAAKGTALLGVKAVITESFERIHRSNLVGMGVLPMVFVDGKNQDTLGLSGDEIYDIHGLSSNLTPGKMVDVTATKPDGSKIAFKAKLRLDSGVDVEYYRHGGILNYVLRNFLKDN